MKVGVIYPQIELDGNPQSVLDIGLAAERLGYDSLVAYDHVLGATHDRQPSLWGPYTDRDPFHDPFVMFAYLAALTRRLRFITGILVLPQRQTALVARQAADLDLLSHERFTLGVGIGWNYVEYEALGQDFASRGKRVEDQIALLRQLWTQPLVEHDSAFHRVDRAALNPRPRRAIPIWLGGFADVVLRRAAAMADGFIFADGATDAFAALAQLRGLLAERGRAEEDFAMHCSMLDATTPQAVVDTARRWRDAGGTEVSVLTMYQEFDTAEKHIAHLKRVADALAKSDLR
jgi:probable F420-dependent oxidoreductase